MSGTGPSHTCLSIRAMPTQPPCFTDEKSEALRVRLGHKHTAAKPQG